MMSWQPVHQEAHRERDSMDRCAETRPGESIAGSEQKLAREAPQLGCVWWAFDCGIVRLQWMRARGALPVRGKGRAHPTDTKATNLLSCLISSGLQARHE